MSSGEINYNSVASFERSKKPQSRVRAIRVFTVILLAPILLKLSMLVTAPS